MKVDIKVPPLGESVSQATVSRIIQPSGSLVNRDQEIIELETDKVNQVLYAPQAGKLELTVAVGQAVTVGQVIGSVDTSIQVAAPAPSKPVDAKPTPPVVTTGPSARVEPAETILRLEKPAPSTQKPPSPPPISSERRRMSGLRRTIAQRLVEVKNTTAMLTSFNEVDMTQVMSIRAREKENFQKKYGVRLGLMSFFVKATTAALKAFPNVHAYIEGDDIVQFPNFDIGVAVSTDKGLMVPVIRGCDAASFGDIEKQIETYAKKARDGTISIDDLRGGCFTITNGGVYGSLLSTPILNPPQSAILGMHSITKRPIAIDDQVVIRPMMYLALSYDHRLIDGKEAVQFLVHIKQNIEDPSRLLLEL
ncbi:MAG: dihydrolipoyllysine-residue succinyltransferase [Rhabdochlamydiaceae bacterium]|nr:dihydrolipoyllysine-residue succinyltransferase [Rhabdochlamydiaceae bacterium]